MASDIKSRASGVKPPNYAAAIRYVMDIPADPITLTSILPDGGGPTVTRTFRKTPDAAPKAMQWLKAQQDEGRNLYYQDCSVVSKNKRPVKADVNLLHCAHADMDVQGGHFTIPDFAKAKREVLDKITAYNPPPSIIIDTGNGYQVMWYLAEPLVGTPENIAAVEAVSKRIAADLGGDNCQDVAHLMRLPYTINFPKEKKRALGRVKCLSGIESDDRWINVYSLASLPSDPVEDAAVANGDPMTYAGIGSPEIPDKVDLSRLAPDLQELIRKGSDGDRSQAVYKVATDMRRAKYDDGAILHVLINPDFGISAHILDQKQRSNIEQASRVIGSINKRGVALPDFAKDVFTDADRKALDSYIEADEFRIFKLQRAKSQLKSSKAPGIGHNSGVMFTDADKVKTQNVQYIWKGRLARGKHTLIAGEAGEGKSQIACSVIATVTTGGEWPDGGKAPQGNCIILSAEDDPEDTLVPRLVAAGADLTKVKILKMVADQNGNRKFNLETDIPKLQAACQQLGNVVLIVIDPVSSYMGGKIQGGQNVQVRHVLDPLSDLASVLRCAILSITHFNKGSQGPRAVHRIMDSIAFGAAPRATFGIYRDPTDVGEVGGIEQRLMLLFKTNLPDKAKGLKYHIVEAEGGKETLPTGRKVPIKTLRVVWDGNSDMTVDNVQRLENEQRSAPRLDEATMFIQSSLADGPRDCKPLKKEALDLGIKEDTFRRALNKLGIEARIKEGTASQDRPGTWEYPGIGD